MPIYSTHDTTISGRITVLESATVTEIYTVCAMRTALGIRVFDIYVPAGFDPTEAQRIVMIAPGQTGNARSNIKDFVMFTLKAQSMTNVVCIGIYGRPDPTTPYTSLDDIEADVISATDTPTYTGYTTIKELDIDYKRFSVGDPINDLSISNDLDFTRTVLSMVRKYFPVIETITVGESNGAVLFQTLYSNKRDKVTKILANSGSPLVTRTFGHTRPISTLTLHGGSDTNVPYVGGVGIYGYDFIGGMDNYDDWVANNGNAATVVMDDYGFENTNNDPAGSVIYEYVKDNGSIVNTMLFVSAGSAGAGAHGLGDLATVDDIKPGATSRNVLGTYYHDFIEKHIPTKW